eukprot:g14301.t1
MPNIVYIESSVFFNCLMNIVTNALKHTDGNVYIESSYTSGRLNVRITDEGPGITKENQHRIFERNLRVSTKTSGLGIGLHSVRESLRWLGSECHIDSPYVSSPAKFGGKDVLNTYGSSFWFELRDENFTCVPAYKEKETAQEAGQLTEAGNKAATAKQVQVNLTTKHENKGSTDLVWNVKGFESTLGKEAKDAIKIFFAEENGIIDDLSLALEKNDFDTVLRRIHKLKTSCKILSAERLHIVALQMMKSADKVYDMILLDDDLGATNGDAAPLRGCDIIRLYKLWLEDEISGNVAEKRMLMVNQVVHLYTFGATDKLKRAKLHADDIAWLLRCPFNKPALSQQLEMLDLNNYPRHSDKTT